MASRSVRRDSTSSIGENSFCSNGEILKIHNETEWLEKQTNIQMVCSKYETTKATGLFQHHEDGSLKDSHKKTLSELEQLMQPSMRLKNLTIRKLLEAETLQDIIMGVYFDTSHTHDLSSAFRSEFMMALKSKSDYCNELVQVENENDQLKKENMRLKMEIFSHALNEKASLIEENEEQQGAQEDDREKRLQSRIDKMEKNITLYSHVLQMLIAHSGMNWAEDENLLEMVKECGKPIDQQLANM